ncbi:MAG: TonB C-terminal domain-containing protein [Burkholderiales bacterium]
MEAQRAQAQRLEAQRQEAQRAEAAKQEALRKEELARQEAARLEAAKQEALRNAAKVAEPAPQPRRRATLIGRPDRDLRLMMYAESWRQKLEQTAPFEVLQAAKTATYTNPLVTVAVRRDGSVESIVFNRSSGVAAIDDAIRQVVAAVAPFNPLPADLALEYDVVEIPRVWTFGSGLRLLSSGR